MADRLIAPADPEAPVERPLDTKTMEVLALAVFRTIFQKGVRVPLKIAGKMDMDLMVRDNNVLLNMNSVQLQMPELSIWRIIFAYQGKPVVEYGRGIKNDIKVHFPQACFFLAAMWREKRRKNKARSRGEAAVSREMLTMSVSGPAGAIPEEAPV